MKEVGEKDGEKSLKLCRKKSGLKKGRKEGKNKCGN